MGHVYLIGEIRNEGRYKIGSTRAKDVNKRLKQLQTGNSEELYIKDSFETEHPFKLEKMLHNRFKNNNIINEWFELSEDDVKGFKGICEECSKVIESLKDNPFYFNVRLIPMTCDFNAKLKSVKPNNNGRVYNYDSLKKTFESYIDDINTRMNDFELYHFNK
jgi:hypothetical protein